MLSVAVKTGRLIEARAKGLVTLPEFAAFRTGFTDCILKPGQRVIVVCDIRELGVVPTEVGQAFVRLMKIDNALVDRSCYLTGGNSTTAMQFDQLIREGNNSARRSFKELGDAEKWLAETLRPEELARFREFVRE